MTLIVFAHPKYFLIESQAMTSGFFYYLMHYIEFDSCSLFCYGHVVNKFTLVLVYQKQKLGIFIVCLKIMPFRMNEKSDDRIQCIKRYYQTNCARQCTRNTHLLNLNQCLNGTHLSGTFFLLTNIFCPI